MMIAFIITLVKIRILRLSSFLHIVSGVVCIVCPFTGDEKLNNVHVNLALLV